MLMKKEQKACEMGFPPPARFYVSFLLFQEFHVTQLAIASASPASLTAQQEYNNAEIRKSTYFEQIYQIVRIRRSETEIIR